MSIQILAKKNIFLVTSLLLTSGLAKAAIVNFVDPYSLSINDTDPLASTLTINAANVAFNQSSYSGSGVFTFPVENAGFPPTGGDVQEAWSWSLGINAGQVAFSEIGPVDIVVQQHGTVVDLDYSGINLRSTVDAASVTGSWTINGPTESLSGNFTMDISNVIAPATFDAANYPNEITIDPVKAFLRPDMLLGGIVDGRRATIDYSALVTNTGVIDVSQRFSILVPVPAALWLFASGLIGLLGISRSKTKAAPC